MNIKADEDSDTGIDDGLNGNTDGREEVEEDSEDDELPPMSVTEAVRDPVYIVSLDPEVKACVLCPGKLLKNATMSDIHKASKVSLARGRKVMLSFKEIDSI